MTTIAKDNYNQKEDFKIGKTLISILGKTCTGKIHLEYNKGSKWIFKTVEADFDLSTL